MENIVETGRMMRMTHQPQFLEVANYPGFVLGWAPEVFCGGFLPSPKGSYFQFSSLAPQTPPAKLTASESGSKEPTENGISEYNRKQKSLEELSKRVLSYFGNQKDRPFRLESIISDLKVERRRVYDIINILQNLEVVQKLARKNYVWNGTIRFHEKLAGLLSESNSGTSLGASSRRPFEELTTSFIKYMARLGTSTTLEKAAELMSEDGKSQFQANLKTKVRRLYDITNVLMSLGVIQKIRKNGRQEFEWAASCGVSTPTETFQEEQPAKGRTTSYFCQLFLRETATHLDSNMNGFVERWNCNMWESIDSRRENKTVSSFGGLNGLLSSGSLRQITNLHTPKKGFEIVARASSGSLDKCQ